MKERLGTFLQLSNHIIGKYYSTEYVRKKILRQTDEEIIEIDEQIEDEIKKESFQIHQQLIQLLENHSQMMVEQVWKDGRRSYGTDLEVHNAAPDVDANFQSFTKKGRRYK